MQLTDILDVKCVKVPLQGVTKYEVITELIDVLDQAGLIKDYYSVLKTVMERELVRSTGVGQGFAIPHGKCSSVDDLIMAVGKTAEPIDFVSIDKQKVSVIFLLISPPDKTGPHIQALALISRLMIDSKYRQLITESSDAEQLYQHIAAFRQ